MAHSLSPVLHSAAYAALGLADWTYERVECSEDELPGWVGGCDASWAGLSVTMPGKRAALGVASTSTERARRVGAANTLVRVGDGSDGRWHADCTDVDGIVGALRAAGLHEPAPIAMGLHDVVLVGAGATASAAVGALHEIGNEDVTVVVREPTRAADTVGVATAYGFRARAVALDQVAPRDLRHARAVVNTTPAGAVDAVLADRLVAPLPSSAVVLDAVYHPWPTPLAAAAFARGLPVATGLDMLLYQAFGQVEQFTGHPAPRAAMRAALADATGFDLLPV